MNEETIEKIISKHKLYMSMDSYEYEAITKVDLYKLIEEIERLNNIIKEAREILNMQLAFTSSYQLNYQSAMSIIEEAKSTLRGVDKN